MSLPPLSTVFAILAVVLIAGCGPFRGPAPEPFATVVVENDTPMDVQIHASRNGTRVRVGRVPALATRELDLTAHMMGSTGELQLTISPTGSNRIYQANPIYVDRGDTIHLMVSGFVR
jgi:hypothetical protein